VAEAERKVLMALAEGRAGVTRVIEETIPDLRRETN
jgi:hypothetical protein